jgi:hypothetical protein
MRPNPLLFSLAFRRYEEETRCCTDEPRVTARSAALPRWSRKLRVALPSAFAVFRRTVREPARTDVPAGTPVRTRSGREVGRVREVMVALPSGRTSYAVDRVDGSDDARVLLIPRQALQHDPDALHAVVDERVLAGLARIA